MNTSIAGTRPGHGSGRLVGVPRAGDAAPGQARRLLEASSAEADVGAAPDFTWPQLKAANVTGVSDSDYAFTRTIIAILRIEGGRSMWGGRGGPVWASPDDIAELRAISDFNGLRLRAEGICKQEAEGMARQASPMSSVAANPVVLLITTVGSERKAVLDLLREDYGIAPAREGDRRPFVQPLRVAGPRADLGRAPRAADREGRTGGAGAAPGLHQGHTGPSWC